MQILTATKSKKQKKGWQTERTDIAEQHKHNDIDFSYNTLTPSEKYLFSGG